MSRLLWIINGENHAIILIMLSGGNTLDIWEVAENMRVKWKP